MIVIETNRLLLREWTPDDAAFLLELANTPDWLRFIGDRGIHTWEDARRYIVERFIQSYQQHGFSLYLIVQKESLSPVGTCGLLKREMLADVDIGYALLPTETGKGYACEAAQAMWHYAQTVLQLQRIIAITLEANVRSIRLLEKLGFCFEKKIQLGSDTEELLLFGIYAQKNSGTQPAKH